MEYLYSQKQPFKELYVATVDDDRRVYKKLAQAKALMTNNIDRETEVFKSDCSIWIVGDYGWELFFSARKGDHQSFLTWENSFIAAKRKRESAELSRIEEEEQVARREYERLKERLRDCSRYYY